MMWRTGTNAQGFTLLELLVTVGIVAFGMVLVYEAFFVSLDTLALAAERLEAVEWSNQKMWEAQDRLNRNGFLNPEGDGGEILLGKKVLKWSSAIHSLGNTLYRMDLNLTWKTGARDIVFTRESYHLEKMNPKGP